MPEENTNQELRLKKKKKRNQLTEEIKRNELRSIKKFVEL